MPGKASSPKPKRQLSLFDSTCIIVGIVVGAGIYQTTPLIAANVSGPTMLIAVWLFGGAVTLVGALCYAELTTTFPREGGDFVYLSRAYGRRVGFLFGWSEYWIIRPGNAGMLAFVFAHYAVRLVPLNDVFGNEQRTLIVVACAPILVLTGMNLLGVRAGKWTQNLLTAIKVVGLLAIFAAAMFLPPASQDTGPRTDAPMVHEANHAGSIDSGESGQSDSGIDFRLAMILVLFTYGGWNEMSYVAAEVRRPSRNLFRALLLGTICVTVIYVLVNIAMVRLMGFAGVAGSSAIAADIFAPHFGDMGARAMSALVCISCLGSLNGLIFTGSRVIYALGTEHRLFAWLGRWSARFDAPVRAILVQVVAMLALVIGFGSYADGFVNLLIFTTPVFWLFAFMVGISLFIFRCKQPDLGKPYRVVLYPWTPLVFCLVCAFLFESSLIYAIENRSYEAIWSVACIAVGVVVGWLDRRGSQDA